MAVIGKAAYDILAHFAKDVWTYGDPRIKHLPMAQNPLPVVAVFVSYLIFVHKLGPYLMKDRKPVDVSKVMIWYNAVQVIWCGFIFTKGLTLGWGTRYSWTCEPLDMGMEALNYEIAFIVYLYFILKIVDLLDTVFMMLKKNFRQVTFLHVYHHAGMVVASWVAAKAFPGGHHTSIGIINCLVHCVMYSYYLACIIDPRTKSAWWKKYITLMQIVQFGLNMIHEFLPLVLPSCTVDKRISGIMFIQNLFFFFLFTDFYLKTYGKNARRKEKDN